MYERRVQRVGPEITLSPSPTYSSSFAKSKRSGVPSPPALGSVSSPRTDVNGGVADERTGGARMVSALEEAYAVTVGPIRGG
ncbi:hypothetical protein CVT25_007690 [Psilocybe cyanescens]|uniref:Uncharacterized protein n=1 Tax=Psilocybe cyanescens TaxID=93625 RepID=A0A409XVA3_PSICY|nr:hypothetical protein CVT25_007690 [Psilocybe cyanescens]